MKKPYTSIPGLGTGLGTFRVGMRHRLYQGADHLLLVQSTGFTDDFRRFYYRDIASVVVRRTQRRGWLGLVLGVMIAIELMALAYAWTHGAGRVGCGLILGVALLFIAVFIVNLVRGPTCACYITSRVQTVLLPTPRRVAQAPRLIDFLRTKTVEQPAGGAGTLS